jgi:glycerol-3-phosphate dehydrogenase
VGGEIDDLERFTHEAVARHAECLTKDRVEHLVHHYGSETDAVVAAGSSDRQLLTPLSPDRESIGAEVRFAVEEEMAVRLSDVVFRRTGLGTVGDPGIECLRRCAEIMGTCLGWSEERMRDEIHHTQALFTARES